MNNGGVLLHMGGVLFIVAEYGYVRAEEYGFIGEDFDVFRAESGCNRGV